jgi:hypothetical protein
MVVFQSVTNPQLLVYRPRVQFKDGFAVVEDEVVADVIRNLEGFDIVEVDEADFPTTVWAGVARPTAYADQHVQAAAVNTSVELAPINPTTPAGDVLPMPLDNTDQPAADVLDVVDILAQGDTAIIDNVDEPKPATPHEPAPTATKKAAAPRKPRATKADTAK